MARNLSSLRLQSQECFLVGNLVFHCSIVSKTRPMLNSFASLTGRSGNDIANRWNNAVNPVLKKGPWTEQDTVTILTLKRDLEKPNPTIARTLNRAPDNVKDFMKNVIDPLLKALQLHLSQDKDEFNASVAIVWAEVQKANLRKVLAYRRPDPTSEPVTRPDLSEVVQEAKEKDERKRKLDELKTKKEEEEAKIRSMIITADEENELADPNCKKEWVLELRAVERKLLDRGIPKTLLDNIAAHYKSQLRSGDPLTRVSKSKKSREAATKDLPFD